MKKMDPNFMAREQARAKVLADVQERLSYNFNDLSKLELAMLHSSAVRYARTEGVLPDWLPQYGTNERLEFLGDAVLDLVISKLLYVKVENSTEGDLSKLRSNLVCEPALAEKGRVLGLSEAVILGPAEFRDGLHLKDSVLADSFEALVAAVFLDSDYDTCERVVRSLFDIPTAVQESAHNDYKSALQERLQALYKDVPSYSAKSLGGEAHKPLFEIKVQFRGQTLGAGHGVSKKKASQEAAKNALQRLSKNDLEFGEVEHD